MSHFDRFVLTRTARRLALLIVLAVLLALALIFAGPAVMGRFGQFGVVNYHGLTAMGNGYHGPTALGSGYHGPVSVGSGYHSPVAIMNPFGQPNVVGHW